MPSSTAEELSEPLLPAEESRENDQVEGNSSAQPQQDEEEPEAVQNDEDDTLIEEGRRDALVVERSTSSAAQQPTRPSGPCYLVKELFHLVQYLIHRPIFSDPGPDHPFCVQVRFLKFFVVTLLGITATHLVVLGFNLEHRETLSLADIWLYDGNSILLDCIVFFSVGRLYSQKRSVDHALWMMIAFVGSMYTSILPKFDFLKHSVTLFEMHCVWPWQLWVFVAGFVMPACTLTVILHSVHAYRQGDLTRKLLELSLSLVLFLTPQAASGSFEFHHWFAGLLLGMHANYDTWYSRATMSWCWGQYMNGIAVWGRDPTLTCAYAQYISRRQGCTAEWGATSDDGGMLAGDESDCWAPMNYAFPNNDPPDWRHCPNTTATFY